MHSRAAGKKPVAVTVLHNIIFRATCRRQGTGHGFSPDADILVGVLIDHRLAGSAGTHVNFHNPVGGAGPHAVGIIVPQIIFGSKGEFLYIIQGMYIPGLYPRFFHFFPVERNAGIQSLRQILQVGELYLPPRLNIHTFTFNIKNHIPSSKTN